MTEPVSFKLATRHKAMTAKTLVKKVQFDSAVQSEEDKFLQCKRWREEGEKLAEAGTLENDVFL